MTGDPYDMIGATDQQADGAESAPGSLAGTPPRANARKLNNYRTQMARANLMLAILFIGGTATIYGLVLRKAPDEASAQPSPAETEVDNALLRISRSPLARGKPRAGRMTQDLLTSFHTEISKRQIPLAGLKKDPFVLVPPIRGISPRRPSPDRSPTGQQHATQAETLAQVQARLNQLRVQSIMMGNGSAGTAIISSNLVTVGQKIDGFTVVSITPKTVVLAWQDKRYTLKMR